MGARNLPETARYLGLDISDEMISVAKARLAVFTERAEAKLTSGDTVKFIAESRRVLAPGGLLCLASLAKGRGLMTRLVSAAWSGVHKLNPKLVGGCRPVVMPPLLPASDWNIRVQKVVSPYGISSEIVIAERV